MANENLRDRLLLRLPQPERADEYRNEVSALIEKNEKKLRREGRYSAGIWIYVALLGTVLLYLSQGKPDKAAEVGPFVLFFLIGGAVELLKHFINRNRVELLKEIKQVQLQVLELQAAMKK